MSRKIIHCDADCFYAAIEMRDNPRLRGVPVAVGGRTDHRGVISTCNYEARRFGVHSAMASAYARKLCPDLIIVPHNMEKYREASRVMRAIFYDYTEWVEPLSLDEAYLDVSDCLLHQGSATRIAEEIRQRIQQELHITVSAGVAPSKFLAKIASDWNKPNGLKVIAPDDVADFVMILPVKKIHGVGKVTAEKMSVLGIKTCGDLQQKDKLFLCQHFGSMGPQLYDYARGVDQRKVKPVRVRKSVSVEHTFSQDLNSPAHCELQLPMLLEELKRRLNRIESEYRIAKAFVKVKFSDFTVTTREQVGTSDQLSDYQALLQDALRRQQKTVRLLGLGVRLKACATESEGVQLELF